MRRNRVCPVERAGSLDAGIRRWVQNPQKILGPYIKEGMTVLDLGCGPGFFSLDIAQMVGSAGSVIASDLQEGMLQKLKSKITGNPLGERIRLHKCAENNIGLTDTVDFILAFYLVHEVPDKQKFFAEITSILKPDCLMYIAEPPFHVSRAEFEETVMKSQAAGFSVFKRPSVFLSKAVILRNG